MLDSKNSKQIAQEEPVWKICGEVTYGDLIRLFIFCRHTQYTCHPAGLK